MKPWCLLLFVLANPSVNFRFASYEALHSCESMRGNMANKLNIQHGIWAQWCRDYKVSIQVWSQILPNSCQIRNIEAKSTQNISIDEFIPCFISEGKLDLCECKCPRQSQLWLSVYNHSLCFVCEFRYRLPDHPVNHCRKKKLLLKDGWEIRKNIQESFLTFAKILAVFL